MLVLYMLDGWGCRGLCLSPLSGVMLTGRHSRRFAAALTGPPREVALAEDGRAESRGRSLIASAALAAWEVVADALRALWLLFLFAPLAVTAPLALQHGIRRQQWLEYLRCIYVGLFRV